MSSVDMCMICLDHYLLPRFLNCLHYFCQCCIESIAETNTVVCPICAYKTTFMSVKDLHHHPSYIYNGNSTVKTTECNLCCDNAIKYCKNCEENYCAVCSALHLKMKISKDHSLVSNINSYPKTRTCEAHVFKSLEFYCCDCQLLLCSSCVSEKTGCVSHKIKSTIAAAAEYRKSLGQTHTGFFGGSLQTLEDQIELHKKIEEKNNAMFDALKADITKHTQLLIDRVKAREKQLISLAEERHKENSCAIKDNLVRINESVDGIKHLKSMVREFSNKLGDNTLLQVRPLLESRFKVIQSHDFWPPTPMITEYNFNETNEVAVVELIKIFGEINNTNPTDEKSQKMSRVVPWNKLKTAVLYPPYSTTITDRDTILVCDMMPLEDKCKIRVNEICGFGRTRSVWTCSKQISKNGMDHPPVLAMKDELIAVGIEHQVVIVDQTKKQTYKFGKEGQYPGQLSSISSLAFSTNKDYILVADRKLDRISMFTLDGNFNLSFGTLPRNQVVGEQCLCKPGGLYVDEDDYIYVADSGNNRVVVFNHEGCFVRSIQDKDSIQAPIDIASHTSTILAVLTQDSVIFVDMKTGDVVNVVALGNHVSQPHSIVSLSSREVLVTDNKSSFLVWC